MKAAISDIDRYVFYRGNELQHRWPRNDLLARTVAVLNNPGLQATLTYRIGSFSQRSMGGSRVFSKACGILSGLLYVVLSKISQTVTGIWIDPAAEVGPGLYIGHFGGVIIGPCKIGENCNIAHGVTLGRSGVGTSEGRPRVGDRVSVATGAKVLGKINIGDDCLIGANTVVVKSLPDRAVAVGSPARIVSLRGSFDYVDYPGMAADPRRIASLQAVASDSHVAFGGE